MCTVSSVFQEGDAGLVLVFSEHFADDLLRGEAAVQLIADGTDPNQASMMTAYAQGVLASCQAELMGQHHVPMQIAVETRMLYNPQMESAYNFVPGVMGVPMRPLQIILSKATPYFVLSAANIVTILLLAVFVMGVPIRGSLFWLAVVSALFVLVALSLGLLISTLVSSQMAALLVSGIGLMMPTLIFSGLIFPIESMPAALRWIPDFIPARWYISAVRKIMIEGVGVDCFIKELGIIALMAVVLTAVALKKFNIRLS